MCGIAGIANLATGMPQISASLLQAMGATISHRGPDEDGIYLNRSIGLSHRRLSIIDLETGQQPMHSSDGKLSLVYNGEIFNYLELKDELIRSGHSFKTHSDTEVILHLYQQYGLDFVSKLNGQFAIALWDDDKQRLALIRDRVGICPLFYTQQNRQLVFASEVKAIKPALQDGLSIDKLALDQIFTFWVPISPRTIFKDVYEVPPGHMVIAEKGSVTNHPYWDWDLNPSNDSHASEQDQTGTLHDLLVDATKIRLRADVPVGAYLSGGLDSSVVVSMIHHHSDASLKTFSLNFGESEFDEDYFQSLLIKHLNTDHTRCLVKNEDIAQNFEQTIYHTEAPIFKASCQHNELSVFKSPNVMKLISRADKASIFI